MPRRMKSDMNPVKKRPARTAPEIRARIFDRVTDRPSQIENLLSPKEQDRLREIATVLEYRRGGLTIFSEGEDAHFVYAIDEGVVRVSRHAENGQRQILAFMVPGDLFGIPDAGIYANTAETVSAVRLYRFPWQQLFRIMMEEPQLQLNLLVRVAYDLRQAQRQIIILRPAKHQSAVGLSVARFSASSGILRRAQWASAPADQPL